MSDNISKTDLTMDFALTNTANQLSEYATNVFDKRPRASDSNIAIQLTNVDNLLLEHPSINKRTHRVRYKNFDLEVDTPDDLEKYTGWIPDTILWEIQYVLLYGWYCDCCGKRLSKQERANKMTLCTSCENNNNSNIKVSTIDTTIGTQG